MKGINLLSTYNRIEGTANMERFIDKFISHYGFEPTAAAVAPGRVERPVAPSGTRLRVLLQVALVRA